VSGERRIADELVSVLYDELRVLAAAHMRRERKNHTLQATAVVHEAYVRLIPKRDLPAGSRQEFLALAGQVVRRVLVDHAKAAKADRRGGGERPVTLHGSAAIDAGRSFDVLTVEEALQDLATLEPRHARLVELRFFSGLSNEEIAEVLGVSVSTIEKDWRFVRSWLRTRLAVEPRAKASERPSEK
jgi:RNA polymerase sigma factor (TIGR02999 family)